MTVEDSKKVDFIGIDAQTGELVLTISDHLEWADEAHLDTLQAKINSYLAFIESGELLEEYPGANGKDIRIDVACKFSPNTEGENFLSQCGQIINDAGYAFRYETAETNGT